MPSGGMYIEKATAQNSEKVAVSSPIIYFEGRELKEIFCLRYFEPSTTLDIVMIISCRESMFVWKTRQDVRL